ncbi:hypothetical protein Q0Z83_098840 [Actinoplanes sichuanensis]|nr:hypothetical protein Q0Z83_098840 [Actinoplanes sichuanensis]
METAGGPAAAGTATPVTAPEVNVTTAIAAARARERMQAPPWNPKMIITAGEAWKHQAPSGNAKARSIRTDGFAPLALNHMNRNSLALGFSERKLRVTTGLADASITSIASGDRDASGIRGRPATPRCGRDAHRITGFHMRISTVLARAVSETPDEPHRVC